MTDLIQGKYEEAITQCRSKIDGEYFEFCFSYTTAEERFREIDRFLWESRHQCTRYQNRYDGPVVVDLTQWARQYPNDYFDAFMYFLKDISCGRECIFISETVCGRQIVDRMSDLFDVNVITLDTVKTHSEKKKTNPIGFAFNEEEKEHV